MRIPRYLRTDNEKFAYLQGWIDAIEMMFRIMKE